MNQTSMTRLYLLASLFFVSTSVTAFSQNRHKAFYLGLNPSVTVEPFYQKGELDVNILPLVFQKTLTDRVDFRLSGILNYGIRNTGNELSHYGGQLAFPIFLTKKDDLSSPSNGFYLAPGMGFTRNRMENHTNAGLWLEPGYHLMVSNTWSISFGLQLGATHFDYDNGTQKWDKHFGVKIVLGSWL